MQGYDRQYGARIAWIFPWVLRGSRAVIAVYPTTYNRAYQRWMQLDICGITSVVRIPIREGRRRLGNYNPSLGFPSVDGYQAILLFGSACFFNAPTCIQYIMLVAN